MRELTEIKSEFVQGGRTVIGEVLELERVGDEYTLRFIQDEKKKRVITTREGELTTEHLRQYMDAVETFLSWEHGESYTDVGGWEVEVNFGKPRWYTPKENEVYIRERPRNQFISNRYGELVVDEFMSFSKSKPYIDFVASLCLHLVSAREFDYQYARYRSMYKTLTDIHGIGETSALTLLEWGCETFEDAYYKVPKTEIPKNYRGDVRDTLKELDADETEQLVDPAVQQEYSDVVIARQI